MGLTPTSIDATLHDAFGATFNVMPTEAGHDLSLLQAAKSWMAGMRPP